MANLKVVGGILIVCVILLIVSAIVYFLDRRKRKKLALNATVVSRRTQKHAENARVARLYQRAYIQFLKYPVLRRQVERVKIRLATVSEYDESTLRKETMKITLRTLGILFVGVLVCAIFSKSLLATLFAMAVAVLLNNILISIFVKRVEDRLLIQFVNYLEDNRHEYQDAKMVDEAMYQAALNAPHAVRLQIERIHRILTGKEVHTELNTFYTLAPNRYLKIYAGVSHLVLEYGDKMLSKGSMYLTSLHKMVREIRDDLMRRNKLSYRLSNLSLIALIPILLSFLVVSWAESMFPVMKSFYDGRAGYIIRLLLYTVSIVCYMLVRKISEIEEAKYIAPIERKRWEGYILNLPFMHFIVHRLMPHKRSTAFHQMKRLLKDANSPLTLEWFYVQRMIVSVAVFVITIALSVFLHWNAVYQISHTPTVTEASLIGATTPEEKAEAMETTNLDNQIIAEAHGRGEVSRDTIRELVQQSYNQQTSSREVNNTVNRITEKIVMMDSEYFKWYELLLAIGLSVIGYYIPFWILLFQKRMRLMEMQNEVDQFHTLISILIQFDRMDTQMILEWMERYSLIFKPALLKCLNDYDQGAEKAIMQLKEDAPYPAFVKIINRLQRSVEKIPLLYAFDDLESEQEHHREMKIERMNRVINQKVFWGKACGWTPAVFLLIFFLVGPMLYVSMMNMADMMSQLQSIN